MNKREPRLSQTDYVNRGGRECPWCGSGDLEGHNGSFNCDSATLEVGCLSCDRYWTAEYQLLGYREIK